jgi:hypothetical protein
MDAANVDLRAFTEHLSRARDIARANGMRYVYTLNVHDESGGKPLWPAISGCYQRLGGDNQRVKKTGSGPVITAQRWGV